MTSLNLIGSIPCTPLSDCEGSASLQPEGPVFNGDLNKVILSVKSASTDLHYILTGFLHAIANADVVDWRLNVMMTQACLVLI